MASTGNKQVTTSVLAVVVVVSMALVPSPVAAFSPVVTTGVSQLSPEGRHVGVHIPGIVTMELDTRGPAGAHAGARFSHSALGGLVNILVDRERDPSAATPTAMRGPIQVRVMGMTWYDNGQAPLTSSASIIPKFNTMPSMPGLPTMPTMPTIIPAAAPTATAV